jgi:hypothetical protein
MRLGRKELQESLLEHLDPGATVIDYQPSWNLAAGQKQK